MSIDFRVTGIGPVSGPGVLMTTVTQGTAKAWSILNGTGTITPRDDFNVSSYTDNGVGDYSFNLATAQPNVNWQGVFQANGISGSSVIPYPNADGTYAFVQPTTTRFRGFLTTGGFSATDREYVQFTAFGDPA